MCRRCDGLRMGSDRRRTIGERTKCSFPLTQSWWATCGPTFFGPFLRPDSTPSADLDFGSVPVLSVSAGPLDGPSTPG